jgi:hypothetical protein
VSLPRGYNEAGAEWLEPWCDEHPDLDGQGCVACIGASHDAWMHRAKAAEREVARLREALEAIEWTTDHEPGALARRCWQLARGALEAGER